MDSVRVYGQQAWSKSLAFLNSDGLVPQLALTVLIVLVIHFIIVTMESIINVFKRYNRLTASLLPYTYVSSGKDKSITVSQKRDNKEYPIAYPSENEVNGVEFSYSFHLYLDSDGFDSSKTADSFKTVFYKGSETSLSQLGPGVFVNAKENTLRIYMNDVQNSSDNFVEVPNIPIGKWFHIVITQKGQNMDVYINGNVAVRKHFKHLPKLNLGSFYVFPDTTKSATEGIDKDKFAVIGKMSGMLSRLTYYAYAISYTQIESLLLQGVSKKIVSASFDQKPPYMHDSWWVTRYKAASEHYGL